MEIGPQWRGEVTDLRRLRWLSDIQQLTLIGEQVNESWIPHLRGMESLVVLKIKRADIRDAALEQLREIPSLRCIKLLYLPIGDEAVQYLKGCRQLMQLKIYGTNISPAGAEQLAVSIRSGQRRLQEGRLPGDLSQHAG